MKRLPIRALPDALNEWMSAPALLSQVRQAFKKVGDPRRYGQKFSLPDMLMSGLAVFSLKYPSLLKFDEQRDKARIRANLKCNRSRPPTVDFPSTGRHGTLSAE